MTYPYPKQDFHSHRSSGLLPWNLGSGDLIRHHIGWLKIAIAFMTPAATLRPTSPTHTHYPAATLSLLIADLLIPPLGLAIALDPVSILARQAVTPRPQPDRNLRPHFSPHLSTALMLKLLATPLRAQNQHLPPSSYRNALRI